MMESYLTAASDASNILLEEKDSEKWLPESRNKAFLDNLRLTVSWTALGRMLAASGGR